MPPRLPSNPAPTALSKFFCSTLQRFPRSSSTTSTSLGNHQYDVHVFNDDHLHQSLQSVATFTNDMNGSVLFSADGATIFDANERIINFSPKSLSDRVWTFDPNASRAATANNLVRSDLYANYVAYAHATFENPTNATMRNAIDKGYLRGFPRLKVMFASSKC